MDGREDFEALWRRRLTDAKLRLDFARNYVNEVQRDFPTGDFSSDGRYAFQRGIRAETHALAEYRRVLRIYTDLVIEGRVPDEAASA